jgi:hypothetical protein
MRFFVDRSAAVAAAFVVGAALLLAAPAAAQEAPAAAENATAAAELGERVFERFEVRDLDESILLRPRAEGSEVRSIEITEDDELLINGRDADRARLDELLGADAATVRELFDLDAADRREALGFWSDRPSRRRATTSRNAGRVEVDVPVGIGHVRVRGSGDDRVSVGRSIKLEEGESAGQVVCVGCSVEIAGETSGDAVAVGGSVRVTGTVGGNAVAIGGGVTVEDGALVEGDGVSVGGGIETVGSGEVEGEVVNVGIGGPWIGEWGGGSWAFPWGAFSDFGRLITALIRTGVLALLAVLGILIARPGVEVAAARIAAEPWKAAFAGLLAQLLFLPLLILVCVVLAVSIIGIPLLVLVPFALLALVVANFLGFVGVARVLGAGAERRFGWAASSVALSVVVGVVLIQAVSLTGRAVSLPGGWLAVVGFTMVGVGFFLKYVAWTMGLGAMTLAALSGEWRRPRAAAYVPPAPPAAPSVEEPLEFETGAAPPPPPPPADDETGRA